MFKQYFKSLSSFAIRNNGHWQTILPRYLTEYLIKLEYTRQRIYTPDNDFIDLDWVNQDVLDKPTVILFHGMEGSSRSHYAHRIMFYLQQLGWRGVVAHARSCSGELNNTCSFYHAGFTTDLQLVIETIKKITPQALFAAGVSLGGNALLKFLGENNPSAHLLTAAIAISVPFDLAHSAQVSDNNTINKILYVPYFLKSLLPKMQQYATKYPNLNWQPNIKSIHQFNDHYITQLFDFNSALEYYQSASSINYLKNIKIPCMILQAENDPLIEKSSWPNKNQLSPSVRFVGLKAGGHAGFMSNSSDLNKALLKLPQIMIQYYTNFI